MSLVGAINTAWMAACLPERLAFQRAMRRVARVQAGVLRSIISANATCAFGRAHDFGSIGDVAEFQRRVPISDYDAMRPSIERIAGGEANVLTCEPVELLEPTSGSTGGEKLIPSTRAMRRQIQRGVAAWIADLYLNRPAVRRGRAYWSISPALGAARRTSGGIPIGFDDDVAYLSRWERWAVRRVLAVPSDVAKLAEIDRFRYTTLLHLLKADDLALVSVWNPTFLTTLLMPLEAWGERLCDEIRTGRADARTGPGNPRRAAQVAEVLRGGDAVSVKLQTLWPRLALISCWGDGAAARQLPALRDLFPQVEIQPKGLLATEAFVSFPLVGRMGSALALRSHFFEFVEAGRESCRLAHELERHGRYQVVVTTGGGLYRYPLYDEIEVVDFLYDCPLIRFLGKADRTSDLIGEKLSEVHVAEVLERIFAENDLAPTFAMLAPVDCDPPRYRLYLECTSRHADAPLPMTHLAAALEAGLFANPHYRYAVGLGQLGPVELRLLDDNAEPAARVYERRLIAEGRRAGSIKPTALDRRTDWDAFLIASADRPA